MYMLYALVVLSGLASVSVLHSLSTVQGVSYTFNSLGLNSLPELVLQRSAASDFTPKCAPKNGMIMSALLGRLGNNLFETAFAHRMATDLCWGVIYRNVWQAGEFLSRGHQCFPNLLVAPPRLSDAELKDLHVDQSAFHSSSNRSWISSKPWKDANNWSTELEEMGELVPCRHRECNFTQKGTGRLLQRLRDETSESRVLSAEAFFVHTGWMKGFEDDIRQWFTMEQSCCQSSPPPEDAVVIHIRDFTSEAIRNQPYVDVKAEFYHQLLTHYEIAQQPIWIMCQPSSTNSTLMRNLIAYFPHAIVKHGENEYDAFCIMQRASTLVLSHRSTFSQAAALSADASVTVHYPIFNFKPFLTLEVPSWKYHLVSPDRNSIEQYDVSPDELAFRMDSETDENVQIGEVGLVPEEELPGYSSGHFCVSWERKMDPWWAANPEWGVATASNMFKQCFARFPSKRAEFLRKLHDIQWQSNCSMVHTRHMWSSGWGADNDNVADGLRHSMNTRRPLQIKFRQPGGFWHYAAAKPDGSSPACATKDMFCHFLPLSECEAIEDTYSNFPAEGSRAGSEWRWLKEYAFRPQQWLRRSVLVYIDGSAPRVPTPCTAMHVRRADVVLHNSHSRKYFPISEYIERSNLTTGANILLFTDDANAIDEAHEFHDPEYNWMYLDRARHRGSEGGWENQTPSKDPKAEVVMLLSIFELSKKCNRFAYTSSGFANMILFAMESAGRKVVRVKVDSGIEDVLNPNNTVSEAGLKAELKMARRGRTTTKKAENLEE